MATANIDLVDGTRIVIEGTSDEIARVLTLYRQAGESAMPADASRKGSDRPQRPASSKSTATRSREGAMQYMRELIGDRFFSERRSIADVQRRLEELGHIYPQTHLSTPLRRLVQSRELRRLKEGGNWVYVQAL